MQRRHLFLKDAPVTMQIAIRARDGFVLASDRKTRESGSNPRVPLIVTGESKVCKCEHHKIVIAFSGSLVGKEHEEPHFLLKNELDKVDKVNPEQIKKWADNYLREQFPPEIFDAQNPFVGFRLLVADASSKYDPFAILDIGHPQSRISSTHGYYVVTGDFMNSSIFWPSYFECDAKKHSLKEVINIAAATILMGHKFNNDGISGLDIWQFKDDEQWEQVHPSQIEKLESHYAELEEFLDSLLWWD